VFQTQNALKATAYRRKAWTCGRLAASAYSAPDRDQLLRMRDSWIARADIEDLLDGLPPLPPALAVAVVPAS
jgi:hypothetical protein